MLFCGCTDSNHSPMSLSCSHTATVPLLFISHLRWPLINTLLSFRIQCLISSQFIFLKYSCPRSTVWSLAVCRFPVRRHRIVGTGSCWGWGAALETEDTLADGGEFQQTADIISGFHLRNPPLVFLITADEGASAVPAHCAERGLCLWGKSENCTWNLKS